MAREIVNKPHPTPSPDGPHAVGSGRGTNPAIGRSVQPSEELNSDPDELNYDSCMDDLNLILSTPLSEPDPVLKSKSSSDTIPRVSPDSASVPSYPQERAKPPRTSEIFKGLGPQVGDQPRPAARAGNSGTSSLTAASDDHETIFEGNLVTSGHDDVESRVDTGALALASDDDGLTESRVPWALLLVMSYSSAVTLALAWVLLTGRSFRAADPPTASANQSVTEPAAKSMELPPVASLPPVPKENLASLGNSLRLGDLEVTPLDIVATRLDLVRSIDTSVRRREKSASLVLRLRLTNLSKNVAFTPLERAFLREQSSYLDRPSIQSSAGDCIKLFPLAVDSEWSIVGQEFPVLEPGESVETLICSEPGAADRLIGEMTWRVRLRVGPYRSDVIGLPFTKDNVIR